MVLDMTTLRGECIINNVRSGSATNAFADSPMQVLNCQRLGRPANPPGVRWSFSDWLLRR